MNENVIDAFDPPGADLAQDVFVRMPTGEVVPFSKIRRSRMTVTRGGPGSGHEGHRGRPGEVGGSLPSGGAGAVQEQEITQAPIDEEQPSGRGVTPQSLSEYVDTYDAVLREGESERDFKIRVYQNAIQIALRKLESMTPEEILGLDRNKFNLAQEPFWGLLSGDEPIEGMDDEQKELLRQSYIFSVQSGHDNALEFMHRRLIAGGKVAPDDTRLLYGAKRPQGTGVWETMPEKLYHVTTAADAVRADAIKSRFELGLSSTKGLGGGESDTISFSADLDVAKEIDRALHEGSAAARGDFTIEQMVRWAAEGVDAPKPYLGFLYALVAGSKSVSDEKRAEIDARVAVDPTDIHPDAQKAFDRYASRERDYRDFEFYQSYWANARAHEGGPQYPLFWGVDKAALASADASQFTILEFTPVEGAMGYQMSGLGEWRTVGGENVELIGEHETLTADEEAEYFGR